MNNKLVIVESPNKIKSIEKYLGKDYKVLASVGHIVKLTSTGEFGLGIDIENWKPKYKINPIKKSIIKELQKHANKSNEIFIATDPDREGEAIADNLVEYLTIQNKYKRIRFNEITENAVKKSIQNHSVIDYALVNAQKTRRMLDRIIGYRLSTLIARKISNYPARPTAGRVQSIALKLIVDKEKLIEAFIPVKYFNIEAKINDKVLAKWYNLSSKQDNKEWVMPNEIDDVYKSLTGSLQVNNVKVSYKKDAKKTPFKQSILYRSAESSLGLSSKQTQSAAQKLYEGFGDGGLISYPRTDSTRMSLIFVKNAKKYISELFGKKYVSDKIKGVGGAQDAHEAIRPTNISLTPNKAKILFNLKTTEFKLYQLIYNRTIQSLMTQPEREILRYEFMDANNKFKLSGSKVIFDGYYKVTGYNREDELPKFLKGEIIKINNYIKTEKETKPPARYNEGSIIQKMDEIGVGRPSTFATTIHKIKEREYVDKEGRALKPTTFGKVVSNKLTIHFKQIINENYTAKIESELDKIAVGNLDFKKTMNEFWSKFNIQISQAEDTMDNTKLKSISAGLEPCPEDKGELIYKRSRKGYKFIACDNWPSCTYTKSIQNKRWVKQYT